MMTNSTLKIALIRVNTFARMISPAVRLALVPASFVYPAATRSATSAADSPSARSTVISPRVRAERMRLRHPKGPRSSD
jgi:hypothetical protein